MNYLLDKLSYQQNSKNSNVVYVLSEYCGWRVRNIFDLKYFSSASAGRHEVVVVVVLEQNLSMWFTFLDRVISKVFKSHMTSGICTRMPSTHTQTHTHTHQHEARFASLAADMLPPQLITDNGQLLRRDKALVWLISPSGYSHDWALGRGWLKPQRKHAEHDEHAQKANRQMQSGNTAHIWR